MDNKTNVYTLDVSEKTFNDVQANKFYITDTKDFKSRRLYIILEQLLKMNNKMIVILEQIQC